MKQTQLPIEPMDIPRKEMLKAVSERNADYDGLFFHAVRTTGIFCRPSCSSKTALPKNMDFFPDAESAKKAGYRPCLRCSPEKSDAVVSTVRRMLESKTSRMEIKNLDTGILISNRFRERLGFTPNQFTRLCQHGKALEVLRERGLDEAVFEAGFDSHSGYRDSFKKLLGTTPGKLDPEKVIRFTVQETSLGDVYIGADDERLHFLEYAVKGRLKDQLDAFAKESKLTPVLSESKLLTQIAKELEGYLAGKRKQFTIPLKLHGTDFQIKAWNFLLSIPYGETATYKQEAAAIGKPGACQAVGNANGKNRITIIIPCHRVINEGGTMGGYGGGLWRKLKLLQMERENR